MYINVEFLGKEPIENVITAMHYGMDKTVFFGYKETIDEYEEQTAAFLKGRCHVQEVIFKEVDEKNLSNILITMRTVIEDLMDDSTHVYFDLTGGESLILVAFGMLSKEYNLPMHQYDIEADKLIELNPELDNSITKTAKAKKLKLDLDLYIEMHGGKINYKKHKDLKSANGTDFFTDVEKMWKVLLEYKESWNQFCDILKQKLRPKMGETYAQFSVRELEAMLPDKKAIGTREHFEDMLRSLENIKVLQNVNYGQRGIYSFDYKNQRIKDALWEGGSVLELHTYFGVKDSVDDCKVGVHIDWDGEIHSRNGIDVENEIDVLCLNGNVPVFISCKSGNLDGDKALNALYELETVSKYFGGKYARKVLAITQYMKDVYRSRAEEMGIEIW